MNPVSLLSASPYILLAFLIASGGAYFKGCSDGSDLAEGQQLREERIALVSRNAALGVTAKAIAGIEVTNTTIKQTLEKEIHEKPVYLDCRHTPDGLRIVNSALTGRLEAVDRGQLPRFDATR